MMIFRWLLFSLSALLMPNFLWAAPVNITDDLGQKIRLSNPARRIIVLTPHLAEILIGLGSEDVVVGFVKSLGRPISLPKAQLVGAEGHLNREKILVLKPDLIIAWGAMSAWQKEQLKKTGVPVFISDPKKVADLLKNKNGIYVIINDKYPSQIHYSGHVDTIINGKCIGGAYTTPNGGVKSIRIWVLN